MAEPNWATVLLTAYESKGGMVQWLKAVEKDHDQREREWPSDLSEVTNLSDEEITEAIRFAERNDLLSQVGSGVHYELTQKGFDVAHERKLRKKQRNQIESQTDATGTLANFTIILGVTALIQALAAVVSAPRYSGLLAVIYAVILIMLFLKKDEWFHGNDSL